MRKHTTDREGKRRVITDASGYISPDDSSAARDAGEASEGLDSEGNDMEDV